MRGKDLEYKWKKAAEEEYKDTPKSVLRYINELEDKVIGDQIALCDVEGCEEPTVSGGLGWRKYGYWCLCQDHLSDAENGKPFPDMKRKALEREANR
jgi:hypothetical protein